MITESAIKSAISTAQKTKKSIELKDGGERGAGRLTLSARPFRSDDGEVSRVMAEWYAYSYRGGRRSSAKLGNYPTLSLAAARKLFREKFAPTISAGESLAGARAKASQKEATLGALFDHYLAHLAGRRSHRAIKCTLDAALKYLGKDRLAASVTTGEFSEYFGTVHARGSICSAAAARGYIHAAFQRAIKGEHDYTKRGAVKSWGIAFNPVSLIPSDRAAVRARNRHLAPTEWIRFFRWLESKDESRKLAPAVRLNMLTGQRIVEIVLLLDQQYDRSNVMLDWEKTKNGNPHSIPLPRQAASVLDELVAEKDGRFFPGNYDANMNVVYTTISDLIREFREKNRDIPHFIARDIRRTWKTLAGAAGISKEMRDRLQNHARGDVASKHYDRWEALPEKRAAMELWAEYVDMMLSGDLDKFSERGGQPISLAEARARKVKTGS